MKQKHSYHKSSWASSVRSKSRLAMMMAAAALAVDGLAANSYAANTDGTWTLLSGGNASGTWSDAATGNWSGGAVADGSGFTANFNTLDITANSTVTLGAARTIGNLIFGDTNTATAASWVLTNGGTVANTLTLSGTPTITVNGLGTSASVSISAVVNGSNGLTKDGAGTLVLTAANGYTGGTTINVGRITAANSSALGAGTVSITSGAGLQLQGNINLSNTLNLNGSSALTNNSGNNTISGTTTLLSSSTLNVANASGSIVLGGTLNLGSNILTFGTAGGSMAITVSASLNGTSSSVFNYGAPGSALTMTNNNSGTFAGTFSLSGGTLIATTNSVAGSGALVVGRNNANTTIRSSDTGSRSFINALSFTGTGPTITFGSLTSSVNGDLTFTGTAAGTVGTAVRSVVVLNKTEIDTPMNGTGGGFNLLSTSTGTLVLAGNNSYTGASTVSGGILLINGTNSGTGAYQVNGGTLGGTGSIAGAVTVNAGGTINPGTSADRTLAVAQFTMAGASKLQFDIDAATNAADQLIVNNGLNSTELGTGTATLDLAITGVNGPYNQSFILIDNTGSGALNGYFAGLVPTGGIATFSNGSLSYTLNYAGGTGNDLAITFTSVPEPTGLSLMAVAGAAILKRRRRVSELAVV